MEESTHWQPLDHDEAGVFPQTPRTLQRITVEKRAARERQRIGPVPFAQEAFSDGCWEPSHNHPVFTTPKANHLGELYNHKTKPLAWPDWYFPIPHHQKELEWLGAFCRAVTYMKEWEASEDSFKQLVSHLGTKCTVTCDDGEQLGNGA